jgi:ABC-type polar amino acid transport system ATPase subunit
MTHPTSDTALTVRGLRLARGAREILRGIDLDVERGAICALMGASGAGKSTILRVIAALEPFSEGTVRVGPVDLRPGPLPAQSQLRALRSEVGMVFQMHALFEHLSVVENIMLAPTHVLGRSPADARAAAVQVLEELGVGHRMDALPRQLSGGEAQRVAIARALATDPHLLLMDEPTASLDPARRDSLGDILTTLAATGRTILMATHDIDFARTFARHHVLLENGSIGGTTFA